MRYTTETRNTRWGEEIGRRIMGWLTVRFLKNVMRDA